jgi:hypothetical protein
MTLAHGAGVGLSVSAMMTYSRAEGTKPPHPLKCCRPARGGTSWRLVVGGKRTHLIPVLWIALAAIVAIRLEPPVQQAATAVREHGLHRGRVDGDLAFRCFRDKSFRFGDGRGFGCRRRWQ